MSSFAAPAPQGTTLTGAPSTIEEELAGPPHPLTPTRRQERISSIDVLRGYALLGIFAMNAVDFALPERADVWPLATPIPTFSGPHAAVNTISYFLRWMFFNGKMRGIFSMLFGAGVILITSRAEARGAGGNIADIFMRRNMWLVAMGVMHAYLIWNGDILYWYGVTALLFLYPCRKLPWKTLLAAGFLVLFLDLFLNPFGGIRTMKDIGLSHGAASASAARAKGAPLTAEQKDDLKAWEDRQREWKPGAKKVQEDIAKMKGGYGQWL
jgi:uncharacterized protein